MTPVRHQQPEDDNSNHFHSEPPPIGPDVGHGPPEPHGDEKAGQEEEDVTRWRNRIGYLGSEVVDYNIVDGPLTGYSYQYPDVSEDGTREPGEGRPALRWAA